MKTMRAQLIAGACAMIVTLAAAYAAPVSGTWLLSMETPGGPRESTVVLEQDGESISGKLTSQRGEMPLTGTLKGNAIEFGYKVSMQGTELNIQYKGTVDGDSMSGTVSFGGMGEGKFSGKKQP